MPARTDIPFAHGDGPPAGTKLSAHPPSTAQWSSATIRERDAHCHRSIDAFIARRMTADEFHCGFRDSTGGDIVDPGLVGSLRTIRELCDFYAKALPPGAGYRVSAEQFRLEVCHLASLQTPSTQGSLPEPPG